MLTQLARPLRLAGAAALAGALLLPAPAFAESAADEHRSPTGTESSQTPPPASQGDEHRATPAPPQPDSDPQHGAPAGNHPAGSAGGHDGDPAGNNGTIKIDYPAPADSGNADRPQPGCGFQLRMFGFDADQYGALLVEGQAPTDSGTLLSRRILLSDDAAGGGQDVDEVYLFTLSDLGLTSPAPNPDGWHLKVSVDAEDAPGGAKQKVLWLDCSPVELAPAALGSPLQRSTSVTRHGLALEQETVQPAVTTAELTFAAQSANRPMRVGLGGIGGMLRGTGLPFTGMELLLLVTGAVVAIATGAAALVASRRRTSPS